MIKAYKCFTDDSDYCDIIYSENPSKARQIAYILGEACEGARYIDIRAKRLPKIDHLYRGEETGRWDDMELRSILVNEYGWSCSEPFDEECKKCRLCKEEWNDSQNGASR